MDACLSSKGPIYSGDFSITVFNKLSFLGSMTFSF